MPIILNKENVVFLSGFCKDIQKLDANERKSVQKHLDRVLSDPDRQNIKRLVSYPYAQYRLKLNDFRVLFSADSINKKYIFIGIKKRKFLY